MRSRSSARAGSGVSTSNPSMYPCSRRIRASSRAMRDDGTLTVSRGGVMALRIRVRKSAVVSVIDMVVWRGGGRLGYGRAAASPGALRDAGDEALVGELAAGDPE